VNHSDIGQSSTARNPSNHLSVHTEDGVIVTPSFMKCNLGAQTVRHRLLASVETVEQPYNQEHRCL